jgi:predicted 2-oxoglutarate/Fe(II)-dependent dioxygenase YbiX
MEINNKLNDFVVIFENVLPKKTSEIFLEVCKSQYAKFDAAGIDDGRINKKIRDADTWELINDLTNFTAIHWGNFLRKIFQDKITEYKKKINCEDVDALINSMQVLKYEKKQHYLFHTDHFRLQPRTISGIFFINDNYEGGQLCFSTPDKTSTQIIEPKANKLILFPSNFLYPHKVVPVTTGTRYTVVTWAL